jgi:hypothetical protein
LVESIHVPTFLQTTIATLPLERVEPYTLAWWGYLAGLFDHAMLAWHVYFAIIPVFPPIAQPDPIWDIFRGRSDSDRFQDSLLDDLASTDPPQVARRSLAWRAFLMALWQYGKMTPSGYHHLVALLPTARDHQALASLPVARGTHPEFRPPNLIESLEGQIDQLTRMFHGDFPEPYAIVWRAYIVGVSLAIFYREKDHYYQLIDMLPPLHDPNPLARILKLLGVRD